MKAIALVCLASSVCACIDAVGPPPGSVPFDPPARYRGWWALTEACSGLAADYRALRWYVVPHRNSFQSEGETLSGVYFSYGNQIVLADSVKYIGSVVRHEMLHALMPNVGGHPRHQFLDRCGDIVACYGPCVSDAGGAPDWSTTAPFVAAGSLTVGILVPSPVSQRVDSGWTPIAVTVTNNAPYPVRVATPPVIPGSYAGPAISEAFKYVVAPLAGGRADSVGMPQETTYVPFAPAGTPGSTRRLVFDYFPSFFRVAVGEYDATGLFLDVASQALAVRVDP